MLVVLIPEDAPAGHSVSNDSNAGASGKAKVEEEEEEEEEEDEERYVILTIQPRIPAGSLTFAELPAGMVDDSDSDTGSKEGTVSYTHLTLPTN